MKPILLKGHQRPLARVRYNRDGDLLYTAGVDSRVCVWRTDDGERVGTYNGHEGAVWDVDVNFATTRVLTGSADRTARIWDAQTGTELCRFDHKSMVRAVGFSVGDKMVLTVQDTSFKAQATVFIYNVSEDAKEQDPEPVRAMFEPGMKKITGALWTDLNRTIVTGGDDGCLRLWDVETGRLKETRVAHKKSIHDLQCSRDGTMLVTASTDMQAKVWDAKTLEEKKCFVSDRPLNSACVSPLKPQILVGGGQEAMAVTTTAAAAGHFEVDFHHLVYQEKLGEVKGHFGPVNSLAIAPDGRSFASGGEDGYVRLHHFDADYFTAKNW